MDSVYPFGQEVETSNTVITESRLQGAFNGYSARARFRLLNGQEWEQESFGSLYRYAFMPRVAIVCEGGSCRMKVEGVPGTIRVRRVR